MTRMGTQLKSKLLISIFLILSVYGNSQTGEIQIKFIGNCGLHLTDGDLNIYVDFPYKSGAFNYMEFEQAEVHSIKANSIFIFTHKHADHYSGKNIRKVLREKGGSKYGKWNIQDLEQLGDSIPNFNIEAIETEHSLSFKHYCYLITWHEKRIFFYGDTENADIALSLKNLDWAFVPYWTGTELAERDTILDTKKLAFYHFYPNMKTINNSPEKIKILINQGERFSIPYSK